MKGTAYRFWLLSVALWCLFGTCQPVHAISFNIFYDTSVTSQPAAFVDAFENAFNTATLFFENNYNDPITVSINVGYGTLAGQPTSSLGTSFTFLSQAFSYSQIKTALTNDIYTSADATALASLGVTDPTNGGRFTISTANAKALGLIPNNNNLDGNIGFGTSFPFTFDPNNRAVAGMYDFIGVAQHEISEVLGRTAQLGITIGVTPNHYTALDLFRYSGIGTRQLVGGQAAYFSIDGGATNLKDFNAVSGADYGDWASGTIDSYNAFASPGVMLGLSPADYNAVDVIGYNQWLAQGQSLQRFHQIVPTVIDYNLGLLQGLNPVELPEPNTLTLLGSGVVVLLARRWMKRGA